MVSILEAMALVLEEEKRIFIIALKNMVVYKNYLVKVFI